MRDFEETWPAGLPRRTGVRRPDPRPFWTPILIAVIMGAALAAVLL